jgi:hypothetical protein
LKKLLFVLLFITGTLFASNIETEKKIYTIIIHALVPQTEEIKAWGDSPHNKEILKHIPGVQSVASPKNASFLLLEKKNKLPSDALIFVTNYRLLEKMQKSAIGGFFWQKGRPNILFIRKNLHKRGIKLPDSMQDFIEDEI